MNPAQNLYLVGPMGVGKTTIGRLLAQKLGRVFVDLDEEIEQRSGASIPWIFDVEGEAGFRRREAELLKELSAGRNLVLSTGGGVVLNPDNRQLLKATGIVVFLNASVEQLYQRTLKDRKRPLLQVPDRRQVIERLKRDRDPLYREVAHLVFDVGHRNSRIATEALIRRLGEMC
ncbi:MAG: shikimate kinase [Porticoccaceae bacterium]|nr:shikimate kinase [Porticoccaceae bacterium]